MVQSLKKNPDPIVASAVIITGLQSVVSRSLRFSRDCGVVSITQIRG